MNDQKIYMGLGGVALLLLLILIFSGGGDDAEQQALADSVAASKTEMAALQERITKLESELQTVTASTGAAASSDDVVALRGDMETGIAAVQSSVDAVKEDVAKFAGVSDGLTAQMSDLKAVAAAATASAAAVASQVAAAATAPAEPVKAAETAPQATTQAAATKAPPALEPMIRSVGETAVLADGALRVFVSRLDVPAENARLAINGALKSVDVGKGPVLPVGDDYCKVVLSGVSSDGAALNALCGDDVPPATGATAGETVSFEEGALRAFISRVDLDGARIALNGTLQNVALGSAAIADLPDARCRVMLDAVDRGHAELSAACGAPVEVSTPVGPGSTTVLGDGAVRIFVASVNDDSARIAINGLDLATRAIGDEVSAGQGCSVEVAEIDDGKVSFKYDCAG